MPKRSAPGVLAGEGNVADHVQLERALRDWSTAELARRVTEAGCPMSQSAIWRIESGTPRRKISVDELIAFSTVFNKSVDSLLLPVVRDYPEDLIRLYVNKWVDAQTALRTVEVRAGVDLSKVTSAAWLFPAAEPLIREMIADRVEETTGLSAADGYLRVYEKQIHLTREMEGSFVHLAPAEIILLGRSKGNTDEEILELADMWGAREAVEEALRLGVVHHVELDFAGYLPLEFLEIREGRVVRSASAGRAAAAVAKNIAKEAGLPPE